MMTIRVDGVGVHRAPAAQKIHSMGRQIAVVAIASISYASRRILSVVVALSSTDTTRADTLACTASGYETYFDRLVRNSQFKPVALNHPLKWTFLLGTTLNGARTNSSKF
jgi:hypothetical protein